MTKTQDLTESLEMYLKTIYLIELRKRAARVTDIAHDLGVIASSVTGALRTLSKRGLINYAPYDIITLTDEGLVVAKEIMKKYGAMRDFLIKVLGIEESAAEEEACHMEHRMSEVVFQRLLHFVKYYETCPVEKVRWNEELGYFCSREDLDCEHCVQHVRIAAPKKIGTKSSAGSRQTDN
ncbi:MAG: metal-dependent transcriptional regulator [Spirochaetaceae bacterium]|nr:MAG: metal-dependent transcriptional regulator [Spirochaetaceae bacterium]